MAGGMTPIRAVIVDDEPWARDRVRSMLDDELDVEIIAECEGGVDAVRTIKKLQPDLVFLDVQMPDLDGFGVIEEIDRASMPAIIFVTAYDAHALRAFEVHALDYLLKPFDRKRFGEAVARAQTLIQGGHAGSQMQKIEQLLEVFPPTKTWIDRLLVHAPDKLYFVHVKDLDWIEAAGNYVHLHARGESHLVRHTMKSLEQKLNPSIFARIHRSTIVNLERIVELRPLFSGEYRVVLTDGTKLSLSKSYRDRVLKSLD